jgi:hypothetical protein
MPIRGITPCGRARHLLLDTARASNPFAAFIEMTVRVSSFKAGSVWYHGVASLSPVFTVVVGQSAYFHRAFSDAPRWWGYSPLQRHASALTLTLPLHFGIPKEWWREWFAVPGPIAIGGTACAHVSMQTSPARRRGLFSHHDDRWRRACAFVVSRLPWS